MPKFRKFLGRGATGEQASSVVRPPLGTDTPEPSINASQISTTSTNTLPTSSLTSAPRKDPIQAPNVETSLISTSLGTAAIAKGTNYGITILFDPSPEALADIVFVHGLTGNAYDTWLHKRTDIHWPSALLKKDITDCRILSFGYDANIVNFWNPASSSRLGNHAENMIGELVHLREKTDTEERKIIFVAHSLGGLVIEYALGHSRNSYEKHIHQIERFTRGVAFLGTPHHGSDLAKWAKLGTDIANIIHGANKDIVAVLKPGSEMLDQVENGFHIILRKRKDEGREIAVTCFWEELAVAAVGHIVPLHSAKIQGYPCYGIHANHMDMTKFPDCADPGYKKILGEISRWKKAPFAPKDVMATIAQNPFTQKPPSNVPFRRDNKFVGQEGVLLRLREMLEQPRRHNRAALYGLGGVGKSQIAIEFSYRFIERHSATWVFWVYASDATRFNQSFQEIASLIKIPGYDDPKCDIRGLVSSWLSDENNGTWLILLDNADDEYILYGNSARHSATVEGTTLSDLPLVSLLPQTPNGTVLITSRNKQLASDLVLGDDTILHVDHMTEKVALELFKTRVLVPAAEETSCAELLYELDYLPLAIVQAAAYLQKRASRITISGYLGLLKKSEARILETPFRDPRRDERVPVTVLATWRLSFDQILREGRQSAKLLSYMSVLDRQNIPELLFNNEDFINDDLTGSFEDSLAILLDFSLITPNSDGKTFTMHRLVKLSTQIWLADSSELQGAQEWSIAALAQHFPRGTYENRKKCALLLPHANTVINYVSHGKRHVKLQMFTLIFHCAWYFSTIGRYNNAEVMNRRALEGREQELGPMHPDTLTSVSNLALVLQDQGKYEAAEAMNRRALEGREQELGPMHPDTLTSVNNLAAVLQDQGKYEAAEAMNRRALEGREQELGPTHPDTLTSV